MDSLMTILLAVIFPLLAAVIIAAGIVIRLQRKEEEALSQQAVGQTE
ncbi:MAG: hypothetical protein O2954_09530 [bacterium]|nr:hypothetical protein [bacterium]